MVRLSPVVLLLFVPLLDTHLAIARRLLSGSNIFHADRSHLHHQLLDRDPNVWKALGLLGVFSGISAAAACSTALGYPLAGGAEIVAWAVVLGSTGLLVAGGYVGGQELSLARRALGIAAKGQAEANLPQDAMAETPDIIPISRGLTGGFPSRAPSFDGQRGAAGQASAQQVADERRVA